MIDKLTAEQSAKIPEYYEKYLAIGLSTDHVEMSFAVPAVKKLMDKIEFDYSKSTFELRDSPVDIHNDDDFELISYGSNDSYRLGYYKFFRNEFGICQEVDSIEDVVNTCGWVYYNSKSDLFVVCDRPSVINMDEGLLHSETGPSVMFRDGFSVYSWRGTRVPKEWIEDPDSIGSDVFLTWENIEQRRAACEIVGWAKVLEQINAKVIDEDADPEIGTLLEADIPEIGKEKFLRVMCGTKREFALPVPPEMKTALEAQANLYGLSPEEFEIPEVRT